MIVFGFTPSNHPQQVAVTGGDPTKDERYTPLDLWAPWHQELGFTLDAAGCPEAPVSAKIGMWCGRGGVAPDGLAFDWSGHVVWCNGPYSDIRPWIEKAWASAAVVDSLWPANRTEQPWWQDLVEPYRDRQGGILRAQFVSSRRQFGTPEDPLGREWHSSPPFGLVRLTWTTPERPPGACPPPPAQLTLL
jgi:hypothetical protein